MSWICFQIALPHNKNQWGQKIKEECDRMLTQQVHEDNGLCVLLWRLFNPVFIKTSIMLP